MLTSLDETFLHQSPVGFAYTECSDHRFFDRMWLGGHSRDNLHFVSGLAAYKNTNTFDGYFSVISDNKQYNLRLSRPLLDNPGLNGLGPISYEVIRPFEEIKLVVKPGSDYPLAAEITFTGTIPPQEEMTHLKRVDGRITQNYTRYDQIGRANGWISVNGKRLELDDWFSARDHSWGVRPGAGGYEAATSLPREGENREDVGAGETGFMIVWLAFETPSFAGYLQQQENGDGVVLYRDGHILDKSDGAFKKVSVVKIEHDLQFVAGTRVAEGGRLKVSLADGRVLDMALELQLPPICYKGTGYDCGYNDERGLGVHRGNLLESDTYDLTHPENVVLPDGRTVQPWHREAGCVLTVNGEAGMGHFPVINSGHIRRYGLSRQATNRKEG